MLAKVECRLESVRRRDRECKQKQSSQKRFPPVASVTSLRSLTGQQHPRHREKRGSSLHAILSSTRVLIAKEHRPKKSGAGSCGQTRYDCAFLFRRVRLWTPVGASQPFSKHALPDPHHGQAARRYHKCLRA
ncbi:hypothetical protein HPB50_021968 [Hyalomma asiaticum]|uniref:Uncharacterized protein n=1 Tax=Hyalomma asiaticum TaxID=266040 RepID=A0ACB7TNZ4_HYAAI|nr:hypothetical protein HPB50_021968 [Hyalomma asiaticum]